MKRILLLMPFMLLAVLSHAQRSDNYKPTNNPNVRLTRTNMPIVFINVDGQMIQREDRVTARVKIIDNGEGQYNYGDTIAHPDQKVDYEGYVGLKYRGNSSFNSSEKKPYSFRPLDKPLEEGGKKQKVKIMCSRDFLSSACWFPAETHRLSWGKPITIWKFWGRLLMMPPVKPLTNAQR